MTDRSVAEATASPPERGAGYALFAATPAMIALLTALSALGQFATNIYLPSLPAISDDLTATLPQVQLTLSAFLGAFAVVQLLYGPVSDRFGRRPVLVLGILTYLAGCLICALASSVEMLIAGRVIQAAGAGAGIVVARAVVRDVFDGNDMAKVMALITIAFALVPGLTPLLGGILQDTLGWRATFFVTLLLGCVVFAAMLVKLPETNLAPLDRLDIASAIEGYGTVLRSATFVRYALSSAFVLGGLFAFFGGSPSLFIDHLGISATEYGIYPPMAVTGFVIGGIITRRLVGRISPDRVAAVGLCLLGAGAATMLILPLAGILHKYGITASMILFVTGLGVFMPTAMAAAIGAFPERAGTAAAMAGFMQMGAGALSTVLLGAMQGWLGILAFPGIMAAFTALAILLFAAMRRPGTTD